MIPIIVKIAKKTNGKVSKALSATTVAKVSSIGYPLSLDRIYALTGSPPPLPAGVILFVAKPTITIGNNSLIDISIPSILLMICQRKVYK